MKRLLLGLTLGMLLVGCSQEPIEEKIVSNTPPITDIPVTTPTKYYNLQWRSSDCNINRILIVNGVQRNVNLGFGEEFSYDRAFKSGDVIQLKITSNGCSSNVWTNQVVIWEWNNPEHQGQHIVKSKSCSNCTTLTSDPFIVP
jgi:hypothetical protein